MVLAILLFVLSGLTTLGMVYSTATERNAVKRATALAFSILYIVVMVLAGIALLLWMKKSAGRYVHSKR